MARVEAVVRIGGSLAGNPTLAELCTRIAGLARQYPLLVIPGGGPFADTVRDAYRRWRLSETAAHKMAILAMDQYGYLLCELIPDAEPVDSLMAVEPVLSAGRAPVLIPSHLLFAADPLPHAWTVTSDSIAAWVATLLSPARLILVKDVDGVYNEPPGTSDQGHLLAEVTPDRLGACGAVDEHLPAVLDGTRLDTWIVNGTRPERLAELLERGRTTGTHVRVT